MLGAAKPSANICAAALLLLLHAAPACSGDVVVFGSTPGAVASAVAAARSGAHVTLADPSPRVGGVVSSGLGNTDKGLTEAIGGISAEFFRRVGEAYGLLNTSVYAFEPHVAEQTFIRMLDDAGVTRVPCSPVISSVASSSGRIVSFSTDDGQKFGRAGDVFIDGTYEGDLMRASGASSTFGREARDAYQESWAGRREPFQSGFDWPTIDPLDADGNILPLLTTRLSAPLGSSDEKVQGYNYRLCLTQNKSNMVPFPAPAAYNASTWELLRRLAAITEPDFGKFVGNAPLPHGKYDTNNGCFMSTDATGFDWAWPNATIAQRKALAEELKEYTLSFFHCLQTDPALPAALRASANSFGLCKDEFTENNNWPEQVYVREASRLVGDRVFIQSDAWPPTDFGIASIGMGSYAADGHYSTRGPCIKQAGAEGMLGGCAMATSEEDLQAARANGTLFAGGEGYVGSTNEPALYQIPYFALLPKRSEVQNLLCPLTPSASHVTFASLRVEPQFMILGHASGDAAAIAAASGVAVQDVPLAQLHAQLVKEGAVLCHVGAPACNSTPA